MDPAMTPISSRAALLSALVAATCFSCYSTDNAPPPPGLRVRRGAVVREVVLTGELTAARGDNVTVPRLPSWQTSIKWLAEDGSEVKKGERVVELDNSAFTSNLDSKRQAVAQARQELQEKEAEWLADTLQKQLDVESKRSDYDKAKIDAGVPRDLLSAREYETRQMKLKRAEVELAKAVDLWKAQKTGVAADRQNLTLTLQKAERELAIADQAIAELTLRAPRDGIVVLRDHPWEGRRFLEGDAVFIGLPIAQLPEMASLQAEAALPDVDDGKIAVGDPATVVLDAYPSTPFAGRVASISAVAQESNRQSLRRAFRVVVSLDRLDMTRMRPGLSARVIVRDRRAEARPTSGRAESGLRASAQPASLIAPRAALDFSGKQPRARLAGGKLVNVTVGECSAQECVVRSGLAEGDALAPAEGPHA
jgi:HlyD family secretion protein